MITYFVWRGCQWVRVSTTRTIWAALPHVRSASLVACGSVLGVLPPLPAHMPAIGPVAPPHSAEVQAPPVVFLPSPLPARERSAGFGNVWLGGACCFAPAVVQVSDDNEREGGDDHPAHVPEPSSIVLLLTYGLFCLGLGSLVRRFG